MRGCGKRWASKEAAGKSKKALTGRYFPVPCRCGGWHLQELVLTPIPSGTWLGAGKPLPKETGPDAKMRALIAQRDNWHCVRCGVPCGPGVAEYSLQHRKARGVGGDNSAPNLILLHGSATTGCHAEVERRGAHDNAAGYWLASWQDPAAEPVMYASEFGSVTFWLDAGGGLAQDAPVIA